MKIPNSIQYAQMQIKIILLDLCYINIRKIQFSILKWFSTKLQKKTFDV